MKDQKGYKHKEAFCHMTYQCEVGHIVTIWNSRDGVTPFGMSCRVDGCEANARHVNWQDDRLDPSYQLQPGDWFWRDGTKAEAEAIMLTRLEAHPPEGATLHSFGVKTIEEFARLIAEDETGEFQPGWPMLDQYQPGVDATAIVGMQTCPERMSTVGPWKREPGLDEWRRVGPDRVCSFCGSMHPDEFEKILDQILSGDETVHIEQSTKSYKVYIRRKEISNAQQGAIKYYKWHTPDDEAYVSRVGEKFVHAQAICRKHFMEMVAADRKARNDSSN